MYNIEEVHCAAAINAVLQANLQLMHATAEEALPRIARHTADKPDTLGLDGITESTIGNSLRNFDRGAVLVTEEIGATAPPPDWLRARYWNLPPTIYVSDPTDRSAQFKEFLSSEDPAAKIGDIVQKGDAASLWEEKFGTPASITGATSGISCVRHGIPINAVFINFITQELFVAFRDGVFRLKLPAYTEMEPSRISLEHIRAKATPVLFRKFEQRGADMENMRHFATFLPSVQEGQVLGKTGYVENFRDSDLIRAEDAKKYLRYHLPGGPSRVLYLSTMQPDDQPVGFVFANGEKIIEWIHWLPFVRFGKMQGEPTRHALSLYEIHQARPWTKEGILMSTPRPYSIFRSLKEYGGRMVIDTERLQSFSNPSRFRSTLLVAPTSNTWAMTVMETHDFREIEFADQR